MIAERISTETSIDMPSLYHSVVQSRLAALFYAQYEDQYLALTQPTLSLNHWESEPDLAIYPQRSLDWRLDEIKIKETPLAIIEIISPRQGIQEIKEKLVKYFEADVPSCWLVNPLQLIVQVYDNQWNITTFSQKGEDIFDTTLNVKLSFGKIFS